MFLDTNVLLYAISSSEPKARIAEDLISSGGTVTTQVLNEFASVALRKYGMPLERVRAALGAVRGLCVVKPIDAETHELGLDLVGRYHFGLYDAMIVAGALRSDCSTLFSEDMQAGQEIGNLTILNPFASGS